MHPLIDGPADWRGPQLAQRQDWIHAFSDAHIAEIDAALRVARQRGRTLATLEKEDFPLPTVSRVLADVLDRVENGPGVQVIRGFPAQRYGKEDLRLIYWGLGKHMGTAVSQSSGGDLLGDVRNLNVDLNGPKGRGYTSNEKLNYHTDFCDVVGLFVLRIAKAGGLSIVGSSVAVHNEIARRRPDLLEVLYQPFCYSWQGQEPAGGKPWYELPIFSVREGKFACLYVRSHILSAQRFADVPRLTPAQQAAIDLFDELAGSPEFHFSTLFQPGDLQLVNNHILYHSRTAFEDYPEKERQRHLLRLWLSVPNSRPLSPALSTIYGSGDAGKLRGGFPSRTGSHVYETAGSLG
jgi:hypothetical protein